MTAKNYKFCLFFFTGFFVHAQMQQTMVLQQGAEIIFKYDDAGNQIYRGYEVGMKQVQEPEVSIMKVEPVLLPKDQEFWDELQIYPVPVKDILTIAWSDEAEVLIDEVSLYEQNTVHWKFLHKNIPTLNKQIQVDMTKYYMGIYVITFKLKDGRRISKNILKR